METNDLHMTANNIISKELKVSVFRTDIETSQSATTVRKVLLPLDGIYSVNIDLECSKNVLRVECHPDASPKIIKKLLAKLGLNSTELSYKFSTTVIQQRFPTSIKKTKNKTVTY